MAMGINNIKIVAVLLVIGALLAGYFYMKGQKHSVFSSQVASPAYGPDYLALKAENTLLKKMLGQVEGDVVILGPVGTEGKTNGKLVWDKVLQGGFIHVENVPVNGHSYSLWIGQDSKKLVLCQTFTPTDAGLIESAFKAQEPVFKAHVFLLSEAHDPDVVLSRGMLP
ncbi:MAG: hypothetical protein PHD76_08815 [Methylacidiphilales bacterium]|nr:hypothetical protein [Candidatus Methylacidiphilales bacterium]